MLRRIIGEDVAACHDPGWPRTWGCVKADPLSARAGHHEPGDQRPRRDAARRTADDSRRAMRKLSTTSAGSPRTRGAARSYVVLAVSDTGHGHGPATRSPYLRAVLHHQGVGKGTGLGLADRLRHRQAERRRTSRSRARWDLARPSPSTFRESTRPGAGAPRPCNQSESTDGTRRHLFASKTRRKCARSVRRRTLDAQGYRVLLAPTEENKAWSWPRPTSGRFTSSSPMW